MIDKLILFPYSLTLSVRNFLYDNDIIVKRQSADVPTICVGNVTVGGTGKTPHTELLIRLLGRDPNWMGKQIAVLSRGYKRRSSGFQQVMTDSSAKFCGDEPLQVKRKFPNVTVAVCKNRIEGCDFLAHPEKLQYSKAAAKCVDTDMPASDIIILDDAYQYRKLKAKCNIVLVNYNNPVSEDKLMPLGHLRDLPGRVEKADIIIVTKCPASMDEWERNDVAASMGLKEYNPVTASAKSDGRMVHLFFTYVDYCKPEPVFPECDTRYYYSKRVILFTGIAKDLNLRQYLSDSYSIVERFSFPDHHKFTRSDIRLIRNASEKWPTAAVCTTEKDAQRVRDCKKIPASLRSRLFYTPIKAVFFSPEEEMCFCDILSESLK